MPWKAPICAPWSYTYTRRLDFSIRALDMNMDKEQAERGQTPEWLREHSTCWLPWFFTVFLPFLLSFSSSSHPSTAWCSGRWVFPWQSWEAKNLNFRTLERVPSVMLTPLSVMLEYSWELMGQNKKFPHTGKKYILLLIASFVFKVHEREFLSIRFQEKTQEKGKKCWDFLYLVASKFWHICLLKIPKCTYWCGGRIGILLFTIQLSKQQERQTIAIWYSLTVVCWTQSI